MKQEHLHLENIIAHRSNLHPNAEKVLLLGNAIREQKQFDSIMKNLKFFEQKYKQKKVT